MREFNDLQHIVSDPELNPSDHEVQARDREHSECEDLKVISAYRIAEYFLKTRLILDLMSIPSEKRNRETASSMLVRFRRSSYIVRGFISCFASSCSGYLNHLFVLL